MYGAGCGCGGALCRAQPGRHAARAALLGLERVEAEGDRASEEQHSYPQSRSPRVNCVPISVPKDLQDQATFTALKQRRRRHATATARRLSAWLGVGRHHGTAPPGWPALFPARCPELQDATLFRRKAAGSHQKYTTKNSCLF